MNNPRNKAINKLICSKKYVKEAYEGIFELMSSIPDKTSPEFIRISKLEESINRVSSAVSMAIDATNEYGLGDCTNFGTNVTVRCLRCEEYFHTSDAKRNRICNHCKELEKEFEYRQKNINTRFI